MTAPTPLWEHHFDFCDARPPHPIRAEFERRLVAIFRPAPPELNSRQLTYRSTVNRNGFLYRFVLRFTGIAGNRYHYSLSVDADWPREDRVTPDTESYFRNSSAGWLQFWTRDLEAAAAEPPMAPPTPDEELQYRKIADEAIAAESHLVDVAAIQQAIVAEMRRGAVFTTSNKEADTEIYLQVREYDRPGSPPRFARQDSGESDHSATYNTEAEFFAFLRRFYDWNVTRAVYPDQLPEFDAWLLIFRLLRYRKNR